MDKTAAAREVNPISFANLVLHGCDTWEYGEFSCIIHEYFCSILAEKQTESFFFNPLSKDVILASAKNFYVFFSQQFLPIYAGKRTFNSDNGNLLY
jgi:hypothetical protein